VSRVGSTETGILEFRCLALSQACHVPSARLTLHSTKLCTKFKIFKKKILFVTKITSETFLSISQNLKVTRLQDYTNETLKLLTKVYSFKVI
jgi:hypothetical protein